MAVLLIAEDNKELCVLLQRIFDRAGFAVLTAPDGAVALELAVDRHPDVVLTDQDMPMLTGLEFARALRRHPDENDVPIMLLSGRLRQDDPGPAEAGICAVMVKPFLNTDLIALVSRLTETGRHRHDAGGCSLRQSALTLNPRS